MLKKILDENLIGDPYLIRRQSDILTEEMIGSQVKSSWRYFKCRCNSSFRLRYSNCWRTTFKISYDLQCVVTKGDAPDHSKVLLRFQINVLEILKLRVQALTGSDWLIYGTRGAIGQDKKLSVKIRR